MPEPSYTALSHKVIPVEGADQVELIIEGSNGLTWSFGIPFSRATGRIDFDEVDVVELDFGAEFTEMAMEKIETLVEDLIEQG
ncbi:MAG: hypothetical protein ACI9D0_001039 [Bacteroidia bacterium]|jgi:hypothetical protein|nr:hypothetical protein [Planctomycetota bacterium]MDG2142238.1 hypothetical protein [Planctomycetota bacterium]